MYVPPSFTADRATVGRLLADPGAADLVTMTADGLCATYLPVLHQPGTAGYGSLLGHVARANDQWRTPVVGEALVIVHGPDAYVSPSWYRSSAEDGRAVPTWDYVTAHVYGDLVVHDDPDWLAGLVRRLTDKHEAANPRPWTVDDASPSYVASLLPSIVGIEVVITRVEAKAKWSQDRPPPDVTGVVEGLERTGHAAAAAAVRAALDAPATPRKAGSERGSGRSGRLSRPR